MMTSRCISTADTRHVLTVRDYPDPYCDRHVPPALAAEAAALSERAKPRLGPRLWPYGPNVDIPARRALLAWAEAHDLRLSQRGDCLVWLRKGRCGGSCTGHRREYWQDHVTGWIRNGKPAVLVAQPYGLFDSSIVHLGELAADPALYVRIDGTGWYGHHTTMIEVWRADARPERRSA